MLNKYFSCGADISDPYFDSAYDSSYGTFESLCEGDDCASNLDASRAMYFYLIGVGM